MKAQILVAGAEGAGAALVLAAPISFWGGVEPANGVVIDTRHPDHGARLAGKVLFLPGTVGSSSASSVLLELVHNGNAPAAIVMHEPDAILLLGLVVAREMGWETPVSVQLDKERFTDFAGRHVRVGTDGELAVSDA